MHFSEQTYPIPLEGKDFQQIHGLHFSVQQSVGQEKSLPRNQLAGGFLPKFQISPGQIAGSEHHQ